ncbi:hypothetical protein C9W97_25235 [Salmonella enterica subsp. enterica serovar Enteritidis]|nr:hypothetical protein [Salmonella enterica subsp. enterica serovar Enteritidis]EBX4816789.1 hypothetical protein [Salmonella enterica subsp. enterica serovar Newport]
MPTMGGGKSLQTAKGAAPLRGHVHKIFSCSLGILRIRCNGAEISGVFEHPIGAVSSLMKYFLRLSIRQNGTGDMGGQRGTFLAYACARKRDIYLQRMEGPERPDYPRPR